MGFFSKPFNSAEVEPAKPFEVLPPGNYSVVITSAAAKPTRDGRGEYLAMEMKTVQGDSANRKLFHNITLANASAQAEEIGHGQLAALCRACKVAVLRSPADIINKIIRVKVAVEKRKDTGQDGNVVKGVILPDERLQQPQQEQAAPDDGSPAW
jgi:hypothetical protein